MIIECLNGVLTYEEQLYVLKESNILDIKFENREAKIINAALDELVGQIVIWLSSKEASAIVNTIGLTKAFLGVVKRIKEKTSEKTITKYDTKLALQQCINVIIQVDNIKILQPESKISTNKYLVDVLTFISDNHIPRKGEIIISYDTRIRIETIDQYARRKMKM